MELCQGHLSTTVGHTVSYALQLACCNKPGKVVQQTGLCDSPCVAFGGDIVPTYLSMLQINTRVNAVPAQSTYVTHCFKFCQQANLASCSTPLGTKPSCSATKTW
jgi:hypothetical protein